MEKPESGNENSTWRESGIAAICSFDVWAFAATSRRPSQMRFAATSGVTP